PHWLTYLAATFLSTDHVGVGGPNIPPDGDGPIAECIANAPGGPVHVLLSDGEAEHIPGCNMAFRRAALQPIGGFAPPFPTPSAAAGASITRSGEPRPFSPSTSRARSSGGHCRSCRSGRCSSSPLAVSRRSRSCGGRSCAPCHSSPSPPGPRSSRRV